MLARRPGHPAADHRRLVGHDNCRRHHSLRSRQVADPRNHLDLEHLELHNLWECCRYRSCRLAGRRSHLDLHRNHLEVLRSRLLEGHRSLHLDRRSHRLVDRRSLLLEAHRETRQARRNRLRDPSLVGHADHRSRRQVVRPCHRQNLQGHRSQDQIPRMSRHRQRILGLGRTLQTRPGQMDMAPAETVRSTHRTRSSAHRGSTERLPRDGVAWVACGLCRPRPGGPSLVDEGRLCLAVRAGPAMSTSTPCPRIGSPAPSPSNISCNSARRG
mmetsp:Transcript_37902/g.100956  ORF Transcript_37902/g.100956 Transcript_37902/m.100956 type:complete len:271 (+) Transcript_37902:488-1300(+)